MDVQCNWHVIAQKWNQPKCLSIHEWISKLGYINKIGSTNNRKKWHVATYNKMDES